MNNRIRFGEPIEPEVPEEDLPPDFLLAGGAGRLREVPFQVYIVQSVYAKIWQHVSETPNIESGGVLVGHPFRTFDGHTTFVVVTAAIPQQSDNRSAGHFTVGTDEIRAAREEMERGYPGLSVVGWYHSHPGHGVFLSGQDMSIVRNIYNASWHIAMVVDPKRRTEGIFVGPEGEQLEGPSQRSGQSWIGLSDVPDSVRAIAIYNQAQERLNEVRTEFTHRFNELRGLVENSAELDHWRERGRYRDITEILTGLGKKHSRERVSESPEGKVKIPQPTPPEPVRRLGCSSGHWLAFSAVLAVVFAAFAFAAAFLIDNWRYWITLGWGVLISYLAVVLAGYVVFLRKEVKTGQLNAYRRTTRSVYFAGERIMALFLIGLVLILWASYGFSRGRFAASVPEVPPSPSRQPEATASQAPIFVPPSATATSTNTPAPTSTCTPTPTDTPTPSPTPTETPHLTFTPTWTPTATLTITVPLVGETTVPTATSVSIPTNPITP